ncbi:MAG: hypothetical protein QM783_12200 [Phycisphaerales bacterium]
MDHDAFTQWDRLPLAYPGLHEGVRGRADADCMLRCVARIEPYELAARALRDRGPTDPAVIRLMHGLDADYRARCRVWSGGEGGGKNRIERPTGGYTLLLAAIGVVGPLSLLAVIATDPRMTTLRGWPAVFLTAPLLIPLGFVAASGTVRLAVPSLTPAQALRQRRCPDCAWHLVDAAAGINPTLLEGVNIGPAACPRCRRPWPLVPPPSDAAQNVRS